MKKLLFPLAILASASTAISGTGPGPWANGAYYPGQYDGRYSANVYNNTQARFIAGEMNTPSGNRVREDFFTVTPGTTNVIPGTTNIIPETTTLSNILLTNIETTISITNIGGLVTTSSVTTTNIATTTITNTAPGITNIIAAVTNSTPARTNLVNSGAASVVSGVLGFGLTTGTPTTGVGGITAPNTASGSTVLNSIDLDAQVNYFVIYVDGDVFAGQTAASINNNTGTVAGSLWSGVGRNEYLVITNPVFNTNGVRISETTEILQFPSATAGGYFNASMETTKSPLIFKGAGEMSVVGSPVANRGIQAGNATYPFNVDGIKVSDVSGPTLSSTSGNATQ